MQNACLEKTSDVSTHDEPREVSTFWPVWRQSLVQNVINKYCFDHRVYWKLFADQLRSGGSGWTDGSLLDRDGIRDWSQAILSNLQAYWVTDYSSVIISAETHINLRR